MVSSGRSWMWDVCVTLLLLCASPAVGSPADRAAAKTEPPSSQAVAAIGDETITMAELEVVASERLARVRSEEYAIKRQVLDEIIERRLLDREAQTRGITVDELLKKEVDARARSVTDDQVRAVFESNPGLRAGKTQEEAERAIRSSVEKFRLQEARRAYLSGLRERAGARVFFSPPRLTVAAGNKPVKGPRSAPVAIVEFADFQCPACGRLDPLLKHLQEAFPDKMKLSFRDYPLPMHRQAPKAAEAAFCAGEQGKYWEMHDKLFDNQTRLDANDLVRYATETGVDTPRFQSCLESGRGAVEWQADFRDGSRVGVSATPTIFINGRMFTGVQPYETLSAVVKEELAAAASPGSDPPRPAGTERRH